VALFTTGVLDPFASAVTRHAASPGISFPAPTWTDTVGPIALSSPTVATIDGVSAVIFANESGYLYAVNALTGENLPGWPQPIDVAPGVPTAAESSPTVAYLDGPKKPPSIIIGAGSTYVTDQEGGVIAYNANGSVRFKFLTRAVFNEWPGSAGGAFRNSVFSTPAVGDLTGDGKLDVVFGAYDHRLYALDSDGNLVPGFPIDTQDTIWSSPALFHVRGKTHADDIFVGGDASGDHHCFGGFIYDFTVTKHGPETMWRHCEQQTIWSSPAIGVINSSAQPAVVVGTGFGWKPPYRPGSDRVYAYYAVNGRRVPGWPVKTAGPSFGSPAIGMLAGQTTPSVVDTSWCLSCTTNTGESMIYAWNGAGQQIWSQTLSGPNDFASPVLADLTGSGGNDVIVGSSNGLYPLSGSNGAFLFGTSEADAINTASVLNAVAVADIPGDGPASGWHMFETCGGPEQVTTTGRLIDYPLPTTPGTAPSWPMWRQNPAHQGVATSTIPRSSR
jgi:hypothetical protein